MIPNEVLHIIKRYFENKIYIYKYGKLHYQESETTKIFTFSKPKTKKDFPYRKPKPLTSNYENTKSAQKVYYLFFNHMRTT